MEGDKRVDVLMLPVMAAIKRYVKNDDAVTEIYNRAYEAILMSMDANKVTTSMIEKVEREGANG